MTDEHIAGKRRRTAAELEQIVREFESCGLNRSQFCQEKGLTWAVLNRYMRRLQKRGGSGASREGLIAVELADNQLGGERSGSGGLAVVLGRGRRIAVSPGFDAVTLQRLVQVLETV
jgi:hypothetical protein